MDSFKQEIMLGNAYYKAALIKGTFEYYTVFECMAEKEAIEKEAIEKEALASIEKGISVLLGEAENVEEVCCGLKKQREDNINKIQVLTAYIDIFRIYEYVLNRMEQKYYAEEPMNEAIFADKLFQYIFSIKDNMLINENIKESIGQLPVRMTTAHYFERIKESLTIYKGGERASLQSFLYMIRSCAMLYTPEGMDETFLTCKEAVTLLQQADYAKLSETEYKSLIVSLKKMAGELIEKIDFYTSIQELLNSIYTAVLALTFREEGVFLEESVCLEILESTRKGEIEKIEDKLVLLEGKQEKAFDKIMRLEGRLLDGIGENTEENILKLVKMGKLMSTSIFINLEEETDTKVADEAFIREETETLITELKELFKKNPKVVNRAVMANTLDKLPIFFSTTQEVKDYIESSLKQCSDFSEKNVSMKVLSELMGL